MDRKKYFDYLSETSSMVMPVIMASIENVVTETPDLKDILSLLAKQRQDKLLLKPTLFRLAYEVCGGKEFEKYLPFAAACEMLNISSYQANASFDNKLGVLSKRDKDSQMIASMITRELTDKLLHKLLDYNIELKVIADLDECLSVSNLYIYKAQHYDLNILSFYNPKMVERYISDRELFLRDYHTRCFYGSGIFSGQVALAGAIAANADDVYKKSLQEFGEIYGTALHKINDLGDFLPGDERNGKLYQDFFCDIQNGRLTYPIYELYTKYNSIYSKIVNVLKADQPDFDAIHALFVSLNIADDVRKEAKDAYVAAKKSVQHIPLSEYKRGLFSMLSVLKSNKYYHRALM